MGKERIENIEIIELNRNGVRVEEQDLPLPLQFHYFDDNGWSPDGNFDEDNIAGTWVLVDGRREIGTYAYRTIDDCTLIVEEDLREYLISELEKNCVDENWDNLELKELAAHYNELLQQG